jgi:hypothetical protein
MHSFRVVQLEQRLQRGHAAFYSNPPVCSRLLCLSQERESRREPTCTFPLNNRWIWDTLAPSTRHPKASIHARPCPSLALGCSLPLPIGRSDLVETETETALRGHCQQPTGRQLPGPDRYTARRSNCRGARSSPRLRRTTYDVRRTTVLKLPPTTQWRTTGMPKKGG